MNRFTVSLEFLDDDNDLITKTLEFYFLNQNLINRISGVFGKFEEMRRLYIFIESVSARKDEIAESDSNKVEQWNQLRKELKEARIRFAELSSKDGVMKEKIDVIKDVLQKNKIEDRRFYQDDFWENNVDPSEIQAFLMSILMRGKKKETIIEPKKSESLG